jgi:hypothetical protein
MESVKLLQFVLKIKIFIYFKIKELSERAHIPHAPHIDRSNAKFLK